MKDMKKRKLNSTNPKYQTVQVDKQPTVKEKRLIASNKRIKVYAVFLNN